MLDGIGSAQMEQEIQKRVIVITKETEGIMSEQMGIQSSLREQRIRKLMERSPIREYKVASGVILHLLVKDEILGIRRTYKNRI